MTRKVEIGLIQTAPASPSKEENIQRGLSLIDQVAQEPVDFIVFPEMFTTQFFCVGHTDQKYFALAEPIPGPTTEALGERPASTAATSSSPCTKRVAWRGSITTARP